MLKFFLFASLIFSFNSFAETCEGFNACADLYTKLTGEKLTIDKDISDEMSMASTSANLTSANAKTEFTLFLNKNVVALQPKGLVMSLRHGEYLSAPIYVVSEGNIPRMFTKEGKVTFIYHAQHDTKKVVTAKARASMSKKSKKSLNNIVEFSQSKIIAVSDTVEAATKIIKEVMKADN
ncbi:MAG: hypothetical protein H7177_05430 [Rhizobacter sp.]|nr:hypothetical protein [Bacteriovorax sp.]